MTLYQRSPSSNGGWRPSVTLAIAAAVSLVICTTSASGRPRTWADQDTAPARQPSWMPFSLGARTPNPAVARITAVDESSLAQGSGTLVDVRDRHGLIVTNWHVIRDAKGPIVATFPDGFRSAATVLKVDSDWDLAALLIWRPKATPITVATAAPRPGDSLTIAGYGAGDYRAVTGRCTQYVAPGAHLPYEMVEVSAEARQGDSGGPIFNQRGELAGVLFGAGGGTTAGSYCGRVRLFLNSAWPADLMQGEDTLVSVPAGQPNLHWPADSLLAAPSASTVSDQMLSKPWPNYAIGSPLAAATVSASDLPDSESTINFQALAGTSPVEQAKSILAAIGILAVILQATRVVRGGPKKK